MPISPTMHYKLPHKLDADWPRCLSAARRRSSAALTVLLILTFSQRFFYIMDNQEHPKRSPQKVRNKGGF